MRNEVKLFLKEFEYNLIQIFLDCALHNYKFQFINYYGNMLKTISSIKARDPTSCQMECYNKDECNYWSFENGKDSGKNCHLYRAHSSAKLVKKVALANVFQSATKIEVRT